MLTMSLSFGIEQCWVVEQTSTRPMKLVAVFLMNRECPDTYPGSSLAHTDFVRRLFEPKDDLQ